MANHDLNRLEEERAHLKYLLTKVKLAPDFRLAIEEHLKRVEQLISEEKQTPDAPRE
jgi:hypothetical protein